MNSRQIRQSKRYRQEQMAERVFDYPALERHAQRMIKMQDSGKAEKYDWERLYVIERKEL